MSKYANKEELSLAISQNHHILDEHFRLDFVKAINEHVLEKVINPTYFRPEFIGFDEPIERNNPDHPVIIASNHSGMAFPWDAVVFGCGIFKMKDYQLDKLFRPLASPLLSKTRLMNPFMIDNTWKMCGGIDATYLNFETLMHNKEGNVLIYPEGVPGIGKGFNRKYQLQRLATSFIKMAIKYKTDIVSFSTVNAEYVNPYSYSFAPINNISKKIGIPFFPISIQTLLIFIQPWSFYLSFPAKITFVKGDRIKPYELAGKELEDMTDDEIKDVRDQVGALMQASLTKAVAEHGKKPFRWGEMWKASWKNRKYFPYYYPFMWPFLFTEFERQMKNAKSGDDINIEIGWFSWLKWLIKSPIILAYYIPIFGWIPLLMKGYKGNKL
jgi:hypothetical protein